MSKRICVFGTSITQGARDLECGGWVTRLWRFVEIGIEKDDIKDDITIYNLGVSGDTSEEIITRFASEFKHRAREYAENIIIFDMGINDSVFRKSLNQNFVPMDKYKENLEKMYNGAKVLADKVIFAGLTYINEKIITPAPWATDFYYYFNNAKEYNEAVQEFCQKIKVDFIDIFNTVDDNDLKDGLHPNAQGHEKIFTRVKEFLIDNKII